MILHVYGVIHLILQMLFEKVFKRDLFRNRKERRKIHTHDYVESFMGSLESCASHYMLVPK